MNLYSEQRFVTLQGKDLQDPKLRDPVIGVLKRSYEYYGVWLGDDHFREKTLPNTTLIQYLEVNNHIAAADLYNGNRMLMLGVDPEVQGSKLAQELLSRSLELNQRTWMTASATPDALAMIALLSNPKFDLKLVESLSEIEELFRDTNNVFSDDKFYGQEIEYVYLQKKLGRDRYFAFTHSRSVHGPDYLQFAFKYVSQRADTIA